MRATPATDVAAPELSPGVDSHHRMVMSVHGETAASRDAVASQRRHGGDDNRLAPYYEDSHCTIYHADCRVIMPTLSAFDLLLCDPPYGIDADNRKRILSRGKLAKPQDYGESQWDKEPVEEWVMFLARRLCKWQVIFGGNYYDLPPARCWLLWDKDNGENDFADCEMAWTNLDKAVRRIRHQWNGMLRKGNEPRWHPTQKPLDVMAWALRQAPEDVRTVLDPWMGSGTTLRACKDANKRCVGIEREERYCELAAKRLSQEVFDFTPAVGEPMATVPAADRGNTTPSTTAPGHNARDMPRR